MSSCECGCQRSATVRRAILDSMRSHFKTNPMFPKVLHRQDQFVFATKLEQFPFCCTYNLREYLLAWRKEVRIVCRRQLLALIEDIPRNHANCSQAVGCTVFKGRNKDPLVCSPLDREVLAKRCDCIDFPAIPEERLFEAATMFNREGFRHVTWPAVKNEIWTGTNPAKLFYLLDALPDCHRSALVSLYDRVKSCEKVHLFNELQLMYQDFPGGLLPVRNIVGMELPEDYYVFLFPQQYKELEDDEASTPCVEYKENLPFKTRKDKLWCYANLLKVLNVRPQGDTSALPIMTSSGLQQQPSAVELFVPGCPTCYNCCGPEFAYIAFLKRFPPSLLQQITNLMLIFENLDSSDPSNYNANFNYENCAGVLRTATAELLRRPKYVVSALREWYRHQQTARTPNGYAFEDALVVAQRFANDPAFASVASEVKEFLWSKEWTNEESYKMSNEIHFAPWPWRCECRAGFSNDVTTVDEIAWQLMPSLWRIEPNEWSKRTIFETMVELEDTLYSIHPCMFHTIEGHMVDFHGRHADFFDSVLEWMRSTKDGGQSPYNVIEKLRILEANKAIDWSRPAGEFVKYTDLFRLANVLERDGYEVVPNCMRHILQDALYQQAPSIDGNLIPRRMKPCRHPLEQPVTSTYIIAMSVEVFFALRNSAPTSFGVATFREIVNTLMRVPPCWIHELIRLRGDLKMSKYSDVYKIIRRASVDDAYFKSHYIEKTATWIKDAKSKQTAKAAPSSANGKQKQVGRNGADASGDGIQQKLASGPPKITKTQRKARANATLEYSLRQEAVKDDAAMRQVLRQDPDVVLPDPIPCLICDGGSALIQPKTEAYFKVKCYNERPHEICLHKACFRKVFEDKRKKEIKSDGMCPVVGCSILMEYIYEVDMELNDHLFLKWDPPAGRRVSESAKSTSPVKAGEKRDSHNLNEEHSCDTKSFGENYHQSEESESEPASSEAAATAFVEEAPKPKLAPPPLPLHLADKAVRLERKNAETVEKYSVAAGATNVKKQRQRAPREVVKIDLSIVGSSRTASVNDEGTTTVSHATAAPPQPVLNIAGRPSPTSAPTWSPSRNDDFVVSAPCAICLDEMSALEAQSSCPRCKQSLHTECVEQWLVTQSTCPACRGRWLDNTAYPPLFS